MSDTADFELWVDDEMVAAASGPRIAAFQEILLYFGQYKDDGVARVYEVKRELVWGNDERKG